MAVKKSSEEKFILSYFEKLNISPSRNANQFWENIERNHGRETRKELEDIVEGRDKSLELTNDLYSVKNKNLKLSLDFTRYSANLYRSYFSWLMGKKDLKPKRILDLGCDNGIVTCFYGLLYPEAEIIGIDICENALKCGEEIKDIFKLSNVSFLKVDVEELDKYFEKGYFDMITSIRTLHEVIGFPEIPRHWSFADFKIETNNEKGSKVLSAISEVLDPQIGQFFTWERYGQFEMYFWWVKLLKENDFCLDWEKSSKIGFFELEDNQYMNMLVAKKDNYDSNIYSFFIKGNNTDVSAGKTFRNETAEFVFNKINDKHLVCGFQTNYSNKSGNLRMELFQVQDMLLGYTYSNIGYRELSIFNLGQKDLIVEDLKRGQRNMQSNGNKTFWYENTADRDNFDSL